MKSISVASFECDVLGCPGGSRRTRGLCPAHYERLLRYGDPLGKPPQRHPKDECVVEGCDNRRYGKKSVCKACDQRMRRLSRREEGGDYGPKPTLLDYLWTHFEIDRASGCWVWNGSLSAARYGIAIWGGQRLRAHRLIYEIIVEPIPDGLEIDHLCMNKRCVNPAHLEPVTHAENMRRAGPQISSSLRSVGACPKGHPYSADNTYIRPDSGARMCRECSRQRDRERYRRNRMKNGLSID